jgi:cytochrome b6
MSIYTWLDNRLAIDKLRELGSHKTVPVHRYSVFYYLGGMTLFFFLIQVMTGILLMLYYRPSAEEAFESVEFIMTTVPFGWLIRSIHSWSANLMVFFAFAHLVTVFFMKAYRPPREITWITGCLLLFLAMGFGFSGYLLPWNQLAFFATKVGTDIAGAVPFVGEWMLRFLRGGDRVTGGTLSRFYGWHVAILPAITFGVLGLHLLLVQMKGMHAPKNETRTMKFFPHFAIRDLFGWLVALGVLAALAALMPWELGEKADPFAPAYPDIRPEWYFVFMFQTLKLVPGGEIFGIEYEAIPILLFGLGGLLMLLVPFLDRKNNKAFSIIGAFALLFIIGMTVWGYASLLPLYIVLAAVALLFVIAYATRPQALMVIFALLFAGSLSAAPKTSCNSCHEEQTHAAQNDIHIKAGLGCHDCHGGNPDPKLDGDPSAMDPAAGFIGKPGRKDIPEFCGRCHSSLTFMRRFQPQARVDQVAEYWTSHHGQSLKAGKTNAATCIDCHGVHGIRAAADPESPVYPTHVPQTCGRCHNEPQKQWRRSVHAKALFERGDLSAPTCNDCHGNHGATPPGVESVAFVCGNCHGRESELFRASMHSSLTCIECHENHGIVRPTIAIFGLLPDVPCAFCHEAKTNIPEPKKKREHYLQRRDALLAEAAKHGLKGDARFDWLVDRAVTLEPHRGSKEFAHLFEKFRIGKIPGRTCGDCHEKEIATKFVDSMQQVTSLTARAERILLAAQRGGVEVRSVRPELDGAVDSQIELEVLVHTFNPAGQFEEKHKEGVKHANASLVAGQKSLDELDYRRKGLTVALGLIVLLLVGLGAKIRKLSNTD